MLEEELLRNIDWLSDTDWTNRATGDCVPFSADTVDAVTDS